MMSLHDEIGIARAELKRLRRNEPHRVLSVLYAQLYLRDLYDSRAALRDWEVSRAVKMNQKVTSL